MPRKSLVRRRAGSSNWYCNFSVQGRRFRDSLDTDDRDTAEILAAKIRSDALLGKLTNKKPELSLTQALGRYWLEHGQHLASADDLKRMGRVLVAELGPHTLLSEITSSHIASFVARRRATKVVVAKGKPRLLSSRSVNAEVEHFRAVVNRARKLWGVATPELPWQELLTEEYGEREHILARGSEEDALFAALRQDYHAMIRFALLTGARLANVVKLSWSQVDWEAGTITWRIKSRRPGGERHVIPMTRAVAAILSVERGRHPVYVFTYVARRNRFDPQTRERQAEGHRYPFTMNGWRKEWKRALGVAGITDFRFHDLRHTAATRTLRASGNLRTVQKMLGHTTVTTTLRYTKSVVDDIRAAMEATDTTQNRPTVSVEEDKTAEGSKS